MNKLLTMLCVCVVSLFSVVANAALPTGASTAFTDIQTDGLAMIDLAWPVIFALVGAFVLIKIAKKAFAKIG